MKLSEVRNGYFNEDPVLYRLVNVINGRNYIGLASNGLNNRLFNPNYGYVSIYNKVSKEFMRYPLDDIFFTIKEAIVWYGLENFELIVEGTPSELINEEVLIDKYDSVIKGYNKTLDGLDIYHTKYKLKAFNNGSEEIRLPELLMNRILMIPGIKIGSIRLGSKRDKYKWINNGEYSIRIPVHLLNEFLNKGFVENDRKCNLRRGIVKAHNKDGDIILVPDRALVPEGFYFGSTIRSTNEGKIAINNGVTMTFIYPEDFESYEILGYEKGNLQTTNKGKIAINKDGRKKLVNPENLDRFLSDGWQLGFSEEERFIKVGKKLVNDGYTSRYVDENEAKFLLENGYNLGMATKRESAPNKGTIAVNLNGKTKYINEGELNSYINMGYSKGAGKRNNGPDFKGSTIGKVAINNGISTKFVLKEDVNSYLENGFKLGMAPRRNKL